jgi:hypothetical protein
MIQPQQSRSKGHHGDRGLKTDQASVAGDHHHHVCTGKENIIRRSFN